VSGSCFFLTSCVVVQLCRKRSERACCEKQERLAPPSSFEKA
jgi:hypothetical protein